MISFITAIVSGAISGLGAIIGVNQTSIRKKYPPCTVADGPNTVFALPIDGTCPNENQPYYMSYLSPASNPYFVNNKKSPYQILDGALGSKPKFVYGPSTWKTLVPNGPVTNLFAQKNVFGSAYTYEGISLPLNMCPQQRSFPDLQNVIQNEALALPLPIVCDVKGVTDLVATNNELTVWVISGLPESSTNVPVTFEDGLLADKKPFPNGLASTLYIYAVKDVTLFLELGGAMGGSVDVYANGVNPLTGRGLPLNPGYIGGTRGVVSGLFTLSAGDVLKVFLGSVGQELTGLSDIPYFDGNGQSGIATLFGGANGGGASYICHFPSSVGNPLDKAFANETAFSKLVCVAGGGGGASRNASGGSAGFTDNLFLYGSGPEKNPYGSSGGRSYVLGTAPYLPGLKLNELSGGGGVETAGGQSNVTEPTSPQSSFGKRIEPFKTDGGGSVVTESGSGGGGGGGGLYGGGAGGFNGQPKPNNTHGGGGGGSSWTGLLKSPTKLPVSLNAYRNESWLKIPSYKTFPLTYAGYREYGYLVIGLPTLRPI